MNDRLANLVVGRVVKIEKHPNADKLFKAEVDIHREAALNVIFGAMAVVNEGDLVPVAVAPAILPTGLKIECKKIRGFLTEGMLCLNSEFIVGGEKILTKFPEGTEIGSPVKNIIQCD
jgi:phenylalanyl-tRNA synthetase beta chain